MTTMKEKVVTLLTLTLMTFPWKAENKLWLQVMWKEKAVAFALALDLSRRIRMNQQTPELCWQMAKSRLLRMRECLLFSRPKSVAGRIHICIVNNAKELQLQFADRWHVILDVRLHFFISCLHPGRFNLAIDNPDVNTDKTVLSPGHCGRKGCVNKVKAQHPGCLREAKRTLMELADAVNQSLMPKVKSKLFHLFALCRHPSGARLKVERNVCQKRHHQMRMSKADFIWCGFKNGGIHWQIQRHWCYF